LLRAFGCADEVVTACGLPVVKGYITTHPSKQENSDDVVYDDFMPFKPTELPPSVAVLEYDTVITFRFKLIIKVQHCY
jgi:hypothetical protein